MKWMTFMATPTVALSCSGSADPDNLAAAEYNVTFDIGSSLNHTIQTSYAKDSIFTANAVGIKVNDRALATKKETVARNA